MIRLDSMKTPGDAYMLRRDGTEIWVDVHPYGVVRKQSNTKECNLLPAVFLAKYSQHNKAEAIHFINSYLASEVIQASDAEAETLIDAKTIRQYLMRRLQSKPKTFIQVLEWKGVVGDSAAIARELISYYDPSIFSTFEEAFDVDTRDQGIDLAYALNQEFIRIRIGGRYDSYGDGCYYARIGSVGFNWSKLIRDSVKYHYKRDNLSFVCIERDSESDTGDPFEKASVYAYKTDDGTEIVNLPIEKFMSKEVSMLSSVKYHKETLEAAILSILEQTPSINTLIELRANRTRIFNRLGNMCLAERSGLTLYEILK